MKTQGQSARLSANGDLGAQFPRWVAACWPRSWCEVAIVNHPRYLLRFLVAVIATVAIAIVEMVLGFALGDPTSASAGYSAASMRNDDIKMAIVVTLLAGLPLAVAGFGIRRMDYTSTRDVGVGLLTGSGVAVLMLVIGPAVAETMTP